MTQSDFHVEDEAYGGATTGDYWDTAIAACLADIYATDPDAGARLVFGRRIYKTAALIASYQQLEIIGVAGSETRCGTLIQPDPGVHGFVFHYPNTSPNGGNAGGTTVRNVTVRSTYPAQPWQPEHGYADSRVTATAYNDRIYSSTLSGYSGTTEPEWPTTPGETVVDGTKLWTCELPVYGFWAQSKVSFTDCVAYGMCGNGFNITSNDPCEELTTNASGSRIVGGRSVQNSGHGVRIHGGDASVCKTDGLTVDHNGGWGIYDSGQFGSEHSSVHTASNRLGPFRVVGSYGGALVHCYSEMDQPPSDLTASACVVLGGHHGAGFLPGAGAVRFSDSNFASPFNVYSTNGADYPTPNARRSLSRFGYPNSPSVWAEYTYRDNEPSHTSGVFRWQYSEADGWLSCKADAAGDAPVAFRVSGKRATEGPGLFALPSVMLGDIRMGAGVGPPETEDWPLYSVFWNTGATGPAYWRKTDMDPCTWEART